VSDETNLVLFLTVSLALIATPGPDMIYVVARGVAQGRYAALVSAWGVCCGLAVHTTFAAVGLSALLAGSALAFSAVKYAGAAYLIYLGVMTIVRGGSLAPSGEAGQGSPRTLFLQGIASNVLNPKVAIFFLAFLPQFVSPASGSPVLQMLLLGAVFSLLGLLFLSGIALFSGTLGGWIGERPGFANALRWLTGSVLIALGLRLALPERR
jgi:threonine/homoserine/homoserine lactone efflux protein